MRFFAALKSEARLLRPLEVRLIGLGASDFDACLAQENTLIGFSGALHPGLSSGSIVLASEVQVGGQQWPCSSKLRARWEWMLGSEARSERIVAVDQLAGKEQKRMLGANSGALAVDMESGHLVQEAARQGVELAVLRVIFDTLEFELDPAWAGTGGSAALARTLFARPRMLLAIPGLAYRYHRAAASMRKIAKAASEEN